jgi:hypothetical protein
VDRNIVVAGRDERIMHPEVVTVDVDAVLSTRRRRQVNYAQHLPTRNADAPTVLCEGFGAVEGGAVIDTPSTSTGDA